MRRILSGILATALAASVTATGMLPAAAAPVAVPKYERTELPLVEVQHRHDVQRVWPRHRPPGQFYRHGADRYGWHNGHRGYRYYRPGYRRYGDFWFPAAAFVTGAVIGGAIANSQPRVVYRGSNAHVRWCYDRYRSYRAYDNTYQPYNGPRRQCISPYG